jgi:hypothetical protein
MACVTDYGACCDGVTDDTAAIQATIDANDLIEFPVGTCLISSPLTINKPVVIQGVGRFLSTIKYTNTTMNGLVINTNVGVDIKDIGFSAPLNATAGDIIHLTGPVSNYFSTFKNTVFNGGWNQINTESAYAWTLDGSYHYGYVNTGVTVRNTHNADWGDSTITNSVMSGGGVNSTSVYQVSSGGLRVTNNKFLGGAYAYRLYFANGEQTCDLIYTGNSVENQTVAAMRFGALNNGATFYNIVINSNQFSNQPIVIAMDHATRFMTRIVIVGNSMSVVLQYGIILTNVEDFVVGNNQITAADGAVIGISVGASSQNGKVTGNRTKGFTTGISNSSASTVVIN